ncbi:hypothetical protein KIW84_014089 [Lathyrus oleraceus]|uniref:Uncharacterized protein n=1 Tax=Pisum sativum TaxID=3888 RepID=A0A9D5BM86_PEA|nr:hypothetical protein KIW84_014089 [Pisum sativum]
MLDVGSNRFSGPIPYWLIQQLQVLSLRKNRFPGSLPESLCYLTNIQLLDLSENNLSGRNPKCIKNFSAMSQDVSSAITTESVLYYTVTYRENFEGFDIIALLMWKGAEQQFKNNKLMLRSLLRSAGDVHAEKESDSWMITWKIYADPRRKAFVDAMSIARNMIKNPKLVPGGGAAEMTVSAALKQKSSSIEGIEKWPYEASACQIKIKKDYW